MKKIALMCAVLALSSGFMTYADDIHPDYPGLRQEIICSPTTFVLLPSLALEVCVSETVRRQSGRPFTRSLAREEAVIRERFPIYVGLAARKIETMRSPDAVVDEIVMALLQAGAGLLLVAHRQLHRNNAAPAPHDAAAADRGVEYRKMVPGHGWLHSLLFNATQLALEPKSRLGDYCYPPET